jgi:hypothetical protein
MFDGWHVGLSRRSCGFDTIFSLKSGTDGAKPADIESAWEKGAMLILMQDLVLPYTTDQLSWA